MNLDLASLLDFRPSLIGSLSTIAGTAVGAPIDCKGFQSCLGIVAAGGVQGSTGATVTLSVKVQESADPAAVGTAWSDITNEAMSAGSFSFSGITFGDELAGGTTTATWLPYETVKKNAKLSDGNRKRYIRMHATLSGTIGIGPKFVAGFLMANPVDNYYVTAAVSQPSGNVELTKLL